MIRTFIIDEQALARQGLVSLISQKRGIEVIGQSGDYLQGLLLVSQMQPDVLIINHSSPGLNGLELIRNVNALEKPPKVLVLSVYSDHVWLQQAIDAGAYGYLLKDHDMADLERAIRAVVGGDMHLPEKEDAPCHRTETISARECEVLTLIAEGHTSKEIGSILNISFRTVDHHRAHLMDKLFINDLQGLTKYAVRCGLIDPSVR